MRIFWLLLAILPAAATEPLAEIRARGAELESAHRWEEAADLYRSTLGKAAGRDERFWLLTSLAEVEFERQDYAQSERWLSQAAATVEGLPEEAPERFRLLNARGTLHLVQGNLTAAERDISRAVAFGGLVAPEDRAAALHNLAAVEMHQNRLGEAAAHEAQALAIWRERFGDRHYYVMKAWISLSSLEGLRGDWQSAARSLERALAISESDEALTNYAIVLDKLKRHKEAKAIRQKVQQPQPPLSGCRCEYVLATRWAYRHHPLRLTPHSRDQVSRESVTPAWSHALACHRLAFGGATGRAAGQRLSAVCLAPGFSRNAHAMKRSRRGVRKLGSVARRRSMSCWSILRGFSRISSSMAVC